MDICIVATPNLCDDGSATPLHLPLQQPFEQHRGTRHLQREYHHRFLFCETTKVPLHLTLQQPLWHHRSEHDIMHGRNTQGKS
jgi:hypothetical protein